MKARCKYGFLHVILFGVLSIAGGCTYDDETNLQATNFPYEVAVIFNNQCATAGCHNDASHEAAGGLNLATWDKLFEGSRGGAAVIPYRPDFSTLCYYTNVDTSIGIVLQPTMPYQRAPLAKSDYTTIRSWIQNGAPDKNGFVKFSDYQNKSKLYICNRGCDVVTVLDPASGLAMRYVDVGITQDIEGPCMVAVAPDKQHWYVIFNQGTTIQKFRTSDNGKVGEVVIGAGLWNSVVVTGDSRKAFISDANYTGRILYLDLESMQVLETYATGLRYPYGLCLNSAGSCLYATSKEGNYIYKLDISNPSDPVITEVSLETGVAPDNSPSLNPYTILLSADEANYYVICNQSSELRIMQTSNDSLLGVYATGSNPNELKIVPSSPYLFISCLGVPGTNRVSEINVFNLATSTFAPPIHAGHDSKGMAVDVASNRLYVSNRNVSEGGPAAHHAPVCDGKNGSITAVDLVTLQLIPDYKTELSVDPYYIGQ